MKETITLLIFTFLSQITFSQLDWAINSGPSSFSEELTSAAMVVDDTGNSYTCGSFYNTIDFDPGPLTDYRTSINNWNVYVRKLNANGELLWVVTMGGSKEEKGLGVSLDNNQHIVITGWFEDTADFDPGPGFSYLYAPQFAQNAFAVKLDSSGNYLWSKSFASSLYSRGKTSSFGQNSECYIIGEFSGSIDLDPGLSIDMSSSSNGGVFVTKLDENGNYIWGGAFPGSGWNESYALDIAPDGACIIAGHFEELTDFDPGAGVHNITSTAFKDIFVVSLNAIGQLNWVNTYGGNWHEAPSSIHVTSQGNILVSGYFSDTVDFNPAGNPVILNTYGHTHNTFILKLTNSGSFVWVKSIEGENNESRKLIVDQNENIVIGGDFWSSADFNPGLGNTTIVTNGDYDIYIFELDSSGNFNWATSLPCTNKSHLSGLNTDLTGNLYLSGSYFGTIDFDPGLGEYQGIAVAQGRVFNLKLNSTLSI